VAIIGQKRTKKKEEVLVLEGGRSRPEIRRGGGKKISYAVSQGKRGKGWLWVRGV